MSSPCIGNIHTASWATINSFWTITQICSLTPHQNEITLCDWAQLRLIHWPSNTFSAHLTTSSCDLMIFIDPPPPHTYSVHPQITAVKSESMGAVFVFVKRSCASEWKLDFTYPCSPNEEWIFSSDLWHTKESVAVIWCQWRRECWPLWANRQGRGYIVKVTHQDQLVAREKRLIHHHKGLHKHVMVRHPVAFEMIQIGPLTDDTDNISNVVLGWCDRETCIFSFSLNRKWEEGCCRSVNQLPSEQVSFSTLPPNYFLSYFPLFSCFPFLNVPLFDPQEKLLFKLRFASKRRHFDPGNGDRIFSQAEFFFFFF